MNKNNPGIDADRLDDIAVAPGNPDDAEQSQDSGDKPDTGAEHSPDRSDHTAKAKDDAPQSDRNLGVGIEDSMDASDPPSSLQP